MHNPSDHTPTLDQLTLDSYPIGTPGIPWSSQEKRQWRLQQTLQRDYDALVVRALSHPPTGFSVFSYGRLQGEDYGHKTYELLAVCSSHWDRLKPNILITGGVHGYETSGVLGALAFIQQAMERYKDAFNFLILPCVSPWGFETINRWNPLTADPNRSFKPDSGVEEAVLAMQCVHTKSQHWLAHFDLHETTDSDATEFRPAKAALEGVPATPTHIPDGFYLVGDHDKPALDFQAHIIAAVAHITTIAEPDAQGCLIGDVMVDSGVILYAAKALGLCMSMTEAPFVTTTEVYPDSPHVTLDACIKSQQQAVCAGLDYLIERQSPIARR